jgi:RNA polymerase sigma factor (sigma-70 family)
MQENPYELLYMARQGDDWSLQALLQMLEPMLRANVGVIICRFKPLEIYRDDLIQEARVGLAGAVNTYREDQGAGFRYFAEYVVRRRLWSCMRHLTAASYAQAHDMYSIECMNRGEAESAYEVIEQHDPMADPEFRLHYTLASEQMSSAIQELSAMDRAVLNSWADSMKYKAAMEKLHLSYKSYDGRLQRLRRKIRDAVYGRGEQ